MPVNAMIIGRSIKPKPRLDAHRRCVDEKICAIIIQIMSLRAQLLQTYTKFLKTSILQMMYGKTFYVILSIIQKNKCEY